MITRVLAGANSLAEAAPLILRIMGENQGWQVGELWEVDEGRQFLRCVDVWHTDELRPTRATSSGGAPLRIAPDDGLPGRVWQRHLPLWIPDLAEEPTLPLAMLAAESGLHGAFAIPLRNGPEVIGVMAFFSSEVRQANDDHLSMLSALGGQIGQFMERKRIEQGLRDSEERYRSVIAALDEGIILVDRGGQPDRDQRQRRTDPGALVGRAARLAGRRSVRVGRRRGRAAGAGGELPFLVTLRTGEPRQNVVLGVTRAGRQPGLDLDELAAAGPLRRDAPYAAMASFTDITARKAAEESLRATHAELENRVEKRTSQLMEANVRMRREVEERERAQREMRVGQGGGRHRQPGQERLPRQHEPRAAHAAQRGDRVLGAARAGDLRRAQHQAADLREATCWCRGATCCSWSTTSSTSRRSRRGAWTSPTSGRRSAASSTSCAA